MGNITARLDSRLRTRAKGVRDKGGRNKSCGQGVIMRLRVRKQIAARLEVVEATGGKSVGS